MGDVHHKEACPRCTRKGRDTSKDNLTVYSDGSAFCFACGYTKPSKEWLKEHGNDTSQEEIEEEEVVTREKITQEENDKIKSYTGTDGKGFRGIRKEINAFFGVRYQYDEATGEPVKEFVPTTIDGELVGYKTRVFPKDFSQPIGKVGKECDLIGQFRFKNHAHTCLIVGGEIKQRAAYQMLVDNQKARGKDEYETVAVVSPTTGEPSAWKQCQAQYTWLSQFKKVIVAMDNDEAGEAANELICKILPKGKAFVMKMSYNDADEYIKHGDEKKFINDFYKARQWTPSEIVSSDRIYQEIVRRASVDKLPFPPMWKGVNEALSGGVDYGYICNILAGSGSGKTSAINQCAAYWMKDLDLNIGVLSLEAESGEWGENLLSHYLGKKIALIRDRDERMKFVGSEEAEQATHDLFKREDGTSRLYLLDDRGDYSKLQDQVEEMIIAYDCKIIIIDVVSDIFGGKTLEEVDLWMSWEKRIVKQYSCIIFNISHVRKSSSSEKSASSGAFLTEESIIGSGTQYRSAGVNIALQRDKNNEDIDIRNTTYVHVLKSRSTGWTGLACEVYYDSQTHTLWDKQEWLQKQGQTFY